MDSFSKTSPDAHALRAPRALSINEFCNRYAIGRTTTYREIAAGRLRAVKAGRRTLIPRESAEAWLAALPALNQQMRASEL
jgi:excisionase family DNA binding protein